MRSARIVVDGAVAKAFVPYDHRETAKEYGGRWQPAEKCWLVNPGFVEDLAADLRAAGCPVHIAYVDYNDIFGHTNPAPATDWAAALFDAVGPTRRDATYRAMSRVLHPDTGGDLALQQRLTAARDEAARPVRRAS